MHPTRRKNAKITNKRYICTYVQVGRITRTKSENMDNFYYPFSIYYIVTSFLGENIVPLFLKTFFFKIDFILYHGQKRFLNLLKQDFKEKSRKQ